MKKSDHVDSLNVLDCAITHPVLLFDLLPADTQMCRKIPLFGTTFNSETPCAYNNILRFRPHHLRLRFLCLFSFPLLQFLPSSHRPPMSPSSHMYIPFHRPNIALVLPRTFVNASGAFSPYPVLIFGGSRVGWEMLFR